MPSCTQRAGSVPGPKAVPSPPVVAKSRHNKDRSWLHYLAEDDGLADGDATVDVAQSLVLVFPILTQHVILSDVVQGQLLLS